jgi:glycosyltransferase involved in cell wall biosynthesis
VHVEAHGSDETFEPYRRALQEAFPEAELGGPVPRAEIPSLFARSHVLVNNMRAGAPDKVVYEAAASCLPVLAANPVFDDLLPPELRFVQDDADDLAAKLRALDPRRRPELRTVVERRHSVDHWADGLLATVTRR